MLNQLLAPISALRRGVPEALRSSGTALERLRAGALPNGSGRHRRERVAVGQWWGPPGRHRRVAPNTFRTNAVRALLAGVTVTVIATAAPAHANPAPVPQTDPFDGVTGAEGLAEEVAYAEGLGEVEVAAPTDVTGLSDITSLPEVEGVTDDVEGVTDDGAVEEVTYDSGDPEVPVRPEVAVPHDPVAAINALGGFTFTLPGLHLPALFSPDTAIVVLGYGLQPDGEMRPELINRLYAGYVSALLSPAAPVIVTGGNPQNGVTEAQAMADWLIERGIEPHRIHAETRANSTVQNATFSAQLMQAINVHAAVLITSADHIARALSNFRAAGIAVVATMTPDESPLAAESFGPGE